MTPSLDSDRSAWPRWIGCLALVLALHGLAFVGMRQISPEIAAAPAGNPDTVFELEEPAAPPAPPSDLAVGPDQAASEEQVAQQPTPPPTPMEQPPPPPKEEPPPEVQPTVPQVPPPQPSVPDQPPPPIDPPPPPKDDVTPEPAPAVTPPPALPVEPPPPPSDEPKPIPLPPPVPAIQQPPPQQDVPAPATTASDASIASAPPSSTATNDMRSGPKAEPSPDAKAAEISNWQRGLVAHLERFKRFPKAATGHSGIVKVAFSIDRQGHLVDARVATTSGSAILDAEAIATLRRAEPFPTPPDSLVAPILSFVLPIRYRTP